MALLNPPLGGSYLKNWEQELQDDVDSIEIGEKKK